MVFQIRSRPEQPDLLLTKLAVPLAVLALTLPSLGATSETASVSASLMINEVMFDPHGMDGTRIGGEWVELYTAAGVNLLGFALEDATGNSLAVLPDLELPPYSVVVVFFRNEIPFGYDSDPNDRSAAIALALPLGDYLGNQSGGVRLTDSTGTVVDSIFWGNQGAPAGATADYFDLSFSDGRPMHEGDSLGRAANPVADYTGTAADFDRFGGKNSCSPTPGARNGVEVTGMTGLKMWAQTGVNQVINGFGAAVEPGWFSIVSSKIENSVYEYGEDFMEVTSDHTFIVRVRGVATLLSGPITATYMRSETMGSVHFSLIATGDLASAAAYGFSFSHAEAFTGFHSNSVSSTASTEVVYKEGDQKYPFSVYGTKTSTWSGPNTMLVTDVRVAKDYGGGPSKYSKYDNVVTHIADGHYEWEYSLQRSFPMGPPALGSSEVPLSKEQWKTAGNATSNDLGEIVGSFTQFERSIGGVTNIALAAGQVGTYSFALAAGVPGQLPQSLISELEIPVTYYGAHRSIIGSITSDTFLHDGKLISWATTTQQLGDGYPQQQIFFVDPPVQGCMHCPYQGQIHLHSCSFCDPPETPEPEPPAPEPPVAKEKTPSGWMTAFATCAGAGSGLGLAAGGAIGLVGGGVLGSAAGGVGALPGAIGGAKVGGAIGGALGAAGGTLYCGFLYFKDEWR